MESMEINQVSINSDQAQQLIAMLDGELGLTYAPEHRFTVDFDSFEEMGGVFLVATHDDEPVACGALRPIDQQTTELKRMFVVQSHRGRGLAKEILRELENVAKTKGFNRILLETGDHQHAAMKLYESNGYHRIAPFGDYTTSPHSICYAKDI